MHKLNPGIGGVGVSPSRTRDTRVRASDDASGADRPEAAGCDLRGASPRTGRDKGAGANASEALNRGRDSGGAGYKMAAQRCRFSRRNCDCRAERWR